MSLDGALGTEPGARGQARKASMLSLRRPAGGHNHSAQTEQLSTKLVLSGRRRGGWPSKIKVSAGWAPSGGSGGGSLPDSSLSCGRCPPSPARLPCRPPCRHPSPLGLSASPPCPRATCWAPVAAGHGRRRAGFTAVPAQRAPLPVLCPRGAQSLHPLPVGTRVTRLPEGPWPVLLWRGAGGRGRGEASGSFHTSA